MIPIIGTLIDNILIDIMICCEYFPHYYIKASGVSVTHLFHSRSMAFNQGRFCYPEDIWQHSRCHNQRTTFEGRMHLVSSEQRPRILGLYSLNIQNAQDSFPPTKKYLASNTNSTKVAKHYSVSQTPVALTLYILEVYSPRLWGQVWG